MNVKMITKGRSVIHGYMGTGHGAKPGKMYHFHPLGEVHDGSRPSSVKRNDGIIMVFGDAGTRKVNLLSGIPT